MTTVPRRGTPAELQQAAANRKQYEVKWRKLVLKLRPGFVQQFWDNDLFTVDETLDAWRIREQEGLEP